MRSSSDELSRRGWKFVAWHVAGALRRGYEDPMSLVEWRSEKPGGGGKLSWLVLRPPWPFGKQVDAFLGCRWRDNLSLKNFE